MWLLSAACDCLLRSIRPDTMTVVSLYKAELLQSSHGQELKNESDSKEGYWDRNREAEDRRWGTRNKNLDSVYCHGERKSKNKDRGENKNLDRTRADKILNKSQGSVHWQWGIVHGVTWGLTAAGFEVWNSSRASWQLSTRLKGSQVERYPSQSI